MKKVIALLLIFAMCLPLVACDGEKKSDDDASTEKKKSNSTCSICAEKNVCEWYNLNEIRQDNVSSAAQEYELITVELTENNTLLLEGNEYKLEYDCDKNGHKAKAMDDDGNHVYDLTFYEYDEKNDDQGSRMVYKYCMNIINASNGNYYTDFVFFPSSMYSVVELTEENWRDYFSTDFFETFELLPSKMTVDKDEWGKITYVTIYEYVGLKNPERFAISSEITMECSTEWGWVTYNLDFENVTATNRRWQKNEELTDGAYTAQLSSIYDNSSGKYIDFVWNFNTIYISGEEKLSANEVTTGAPREWNPNPKEILRMKGWLVIKNDA